MYAKLTKAHLFRCIFEEKRKTYNLRSNIRNHFLSVDQGSGFIKKWAQTVNQNH